MTLYNPYYENETELFNQADYYINNSVRTLDLVE
jgi:hypothetical protein